MRPIATWIAFLSMLFLLVGLCGLFASYAPSIPLQRGNAREALLDQIADGSVAPDKLNQLRPALAGLAPLVLDGPAPLPERLAAARRIIRDEERRESASVGYRTRLMLGIVTLLSILLGAGILSLVARSATPRTNPPKPDPAV